MTEGAWAAFLNQDFSHLFQEFLIFKDLLHDFGMRFSIKHAVRETALAHHPASYSLIKLQHFVQRIQLKSRPEILQFSVVKGDRYLIARAIDSTR
jgi:hypothetical protein